MQVIPLVLQIVAEAEGTVGADDRIESSQDLGLIVETVEGRIIQRDQHVGNRTIVERVSGLGQAEHPRRVDSVAFERQQHVRLGLQLEYSTGADWGCERHILWLTPDRNSFKRVASD